MKALPIILLLSSAVLTAAETPNPAAPAAAQPQDYKVKATRFVGEDLDSYLSHFKRKLAINKQERGPFGLFQVPGKTPIIPNRITKTVQKTPFSSYINQIQISVVNAQDKEFLVGARIFRLGQIFPIVSGGERLSVRVESIRSSKVSFKNLKTGEVAVRQLEFLPPGITANADLNVPGVTPAGGSEEQPLHLDLNAPPPTP